MEDLAQEVKHGAITLSLLVLEPILEYRVYLAGNWRHFLTYFVHIWELDWKLSRALNFWV